MKPVLLLSALAAVSFLLSSCEAFIHARGNVYDKSTRQPISGVAVQFLWQRNQDTTVEVGFLADAISYSERTKLRRRGVKDDYKTYDAATNRWGRFAPLRTDSAGKFSTVSFLVGAVFGIPKVSLLFVKEGYKTALVADENRYDSVFYLQKDRGSLR